MCLEACWILRTPIGDAPSGCLTLVSFTVKVFAGPTASYWQVMLGFYLQMLRLDKQNLLLHVDSSLQEPVKVFRAKVRLCVESVKAFRNVLK